MASKFASTGSRRGEEADSFATLKCPPPYVGGYE